MFDRPPNSSFTRKNAAQSSKVIPSCSQFIASSSDCRSVPLLLSFFRSFARAVSLSLPMESTLSTQPISSRTKKWKNALYLCTGVQYTKFHEESYVRIKLQMRCAKEY